MVGHWLTNADHYLLPNWVAPDNVRAVSSLRLGGVSEQPYDSFNLGNHVGDSADKVYQNRCKLADDVGMDKGKIAWLNQIHSTEVLRLENPNLSPVNADGSVTNLSNVICAVMTADCLPVLLTDNRGHQVAALHAGWRGLANGVIENGVGDFNHAGDVIAWLGPAIGVDAFEVGVDVLETFVNKSELFREFFRESSLAANKWYADMAGMAELTLQMSGVKAIYRSNCCTYKDPKRFFSYRRDGVTGRMASLIWKH